MPLFELPPNFPLTTEQAAMLASCSRDTIINHTDLKKKGTRYFIPSRRITETGPIKILAGDFYQYLQRTQRGFLPSEHEQ